MLKMITSMYIPQWNGGWNDFNASNHFCKTQNAIAHIKREVIHGIDGIKSHVATLNEHHVTLIDVPLRES